MLLAQKPVILVKIPNLAELDLSMQPKLPFFNYRIALVASNPACKKLYHSFQKMIAKPKIKNFLKTIINFSL